MFENFGLEISRIFKNAEIIRYDLRHPYVGSEHLLLSILKEDDEISSLLKKYNVTFNSFKKQLISIVGQSSKTTSLNLYTPLLKRIIENALLDAKEDNDGKVTTRHLFISMLEENEGIALRILLMMDVDLEEVYDNLKKKNIRKQELKLEYGIDLNEEINNDEVVVCREKEIERIIETLLRHKKNNPLLVGNAGVGKTAIVEELARRINKKEVPEELLDNKIVMLEMGNLVSGTKYRGEFEEKLTKIIDKAIKYKNVILFIDEIHTMVNAGSADGAISASDILKPYLARGNIKIIGATTTFEYNKYFMKDKALMRRFEKILVNEPSINDTKTILKSVKKDYEKYHNVKITDKNIEDIVTLSDLYIHDKCNPDKSIELLDTICAKVKTKKIVNSKNDNLKEIVLKKNDCIKKNDFDKAMFYKTLENNIKSKGKIIKNVKKTIKKEDILNTIEEKTGVPLTKNRSETNEVIINSLKSKIIGQDEAINKINSILNKNTNKVKSMLFIGTSGIGKTTASKIIGETYNLIKLDMSEYNKETSISKLIGVEAGYSGYDSSYVFEKVREKPYSLILIDEIEKASSKVLNLFLNILDEGKIIDSHNEEIDFNNCVIIATGNIKSKKTLGFKNDKRNFDSFLSKELVARFDDIIEFKTLTYDDVYEYIKKNYKFSDESIKQIIDKSDYTNYGIRSIENTISTISKNVKI